MGRSKWDFPGYGTEVLSKEDLKPSILARFGIKATQKQIDLVYRDAYAGWIKTGGYIDYRGHRYGGQRHTYVYSIEKLKELLS